MKDLKEILLSVQRPGRYTGGEWNAVKKEWADGLIKFLLSFPDTYEVGSSHLGMKILYGILNGRGDCLCERVFSPWPDFEKILRDDRIPAFSLESRRPMGDFDIIGFSLSYELCYTNVLNLLDLGGIPVRSSERPDSCPVVIAGGPCSYNPEPMAEFVDAFVIGEAEDAIVEMVEAYKWAKSNGLSARKDILRLFTKIRGVYVPSLYRVEYNSDRTIKIFEPIEDGVPEKIEKRVVKDLDSAFYPVKQIVPNIQVVHDRIVLEIMRGCKHACRFCQATSFYGPCRERSVGKIVELAKASYAATGYDEISLLSLSSGDHSRIRETLEALNKEFCGRAVSVSVPSLRIEDALKGLPELISKVKKSGLTFAPEAGSEGLRMSINKNIDIGRLFDAVTESFINGWKRIKLYFMIGLPGEKDEDLSGISEMMTTISNSRLRTGRPPADLAVSINAFIPKPHTPFQREAMESVKVLGRKRSFIRDSVKSRRIELSFHPFEMSLIEAALSRGDRHVSAAIYGSWNSGSRFDGWQEHFDFSRWIDAFHNAGMDPAFYAARARQPDEILPWDFIRPAPSRLTNTPL